jgi:hypothetical protein
MTHLEQAVDVDYATCTELQHKLYMFSTTKEGLNDA